METRVIDYKDAIAALLNAKYESIDKVKLANNLADGIIDGYKNEIENLQEKYGSMHPARLDDSIRDGLVMVAIKDPKTLSEEDLKASEKTLSTIISIVEMLEILRQKDFAR